MLFLLYTFVILMCLGPTNCRPSRDPSALILHLCHDFYGHHCNNFIAEYNPKLSIKTDSKSQYFEENVLNHIQAKLVSRNFEDPLLAKIQDVYKICQASLWTHSEQTQELAIVKELKWPIVFGIELPSYDDPWLSVIANIENYFGISIAIDVQVKWENDEYVVVLSAAKDMNYEESIENDCDRNTYISAFLTYCKSAAKSFYEQLNFVYDPEHVNTRITEINAFTRQLIMGVGLRRQLKPGDIFLDRLQMDIRGMLFNRGVTRDQLNIETYLKHRLRNVLHLGSGAKIHIKDPKTLSSHILAFQLAIQSRKLHVVKSYAIAKGLMYYALNSDAKSKHRMMTFYDEVGLVDKYTNNKDEQCFRMVTDFNQQPGFSLILGKRLLNTEYLNKRLSPALKQIKSAFSKSIASSKVLKDRDQKCTVVRTAQYMIGVTANDFNETLLSDVLDSLNVSQSNYKNMLEYQRIKQEYLLLSAIKQHTAIWTTSPFYGDIYATMDRKQLFIPYPDLFYSFQRDEPTWIFSTLGFQVARVFAHNIHQGSEDFYTAIQCIMQLYSGQDTTSGDTVDEDLNDNIALLVAYRALILNNHNVTVGDRRNFFVNFAKGSCTNAELGRTYKWSAMKYRVNKALHNMPWLLNSYNMDFYELFECPAEVTLVEDIKPKCVVI